MNTKTDKPFQPTSTLFIMLMFSSIPMMTFFLFVFSAFIVISIVGIYENSFSLNAVHLQGLSACVPILYIIIGIPALASGIIFSALYKNNNRKKLIWIPIVIYLLTTVLWSMFLTYKTTGLIPAIQVLFSGNNSISYEVIWSAVIFFLFLVVASLGFIPSALLSNSLMTRQQASNISKKSCIILLALALCFTFYSLAYQKSWMPALQNITV